MRFHRLFQAKKSHHIIAPVTLHKIRQFVLLDIRSLKYSLNFSEHCPCFIYQWVNSARGNIDDL